MNKGLYFTLRYAAMTLVGCGAVILATAFYGISRFQANHLGDLPFMADMVKKAGHPQPSDSPARQQPGEASSPAYSPRQGTAAGSGRIRRTARSEQQPDRPQLDFGDGQWGVILGRGAKYYNAQGKFLGRIEGGDLVDIQDIKSTRKGDMAVCTIKRNSPTVVIERRNLEIWPGDMGKVPGELRDLVSKTGKIEAKVQELEFLLKKEHKQKCPDYRAYRKAADAYSTFYDRTQEIIKKRDEAEGAKRTEYANTLQKMKSEGIPLEEAYKSANAKMKRWQRSNPQPRSAADSRMRGLLQELATTRYEIESKYQ